MFVLVRRRPIPKVNHRRGTTTGAPPNGLDLGGGEPWIERLRRAVNDWENAARAF